MLIKILISCHTGNLVNSSAATLQYKTKSFDYLKILSSCNYSYWKAVSLFYVLLISAATLEILTSTTGYSVK